MRKTAQRPLLPFGSSWTLPFVGAAKERAPPLSVTTCRSAERFKLGLPLVATRGSPKSER